MRSTLFRISPGGQSKTLGAVGLRPEMPSARERDRGSTVFAVLRVAFTSALLSSALFASPQGVRVLLIVPPGADLVGIDRARSAVPASQASLLVAESDRVRVKGGLEVLVDHSFASAPAADLVVLLAGEPGPAEEAFLLERRKSARAVLLPPGSALAGKLRGTGGGALVLVGDSDAIPAALEGIGASPDAAPPAPRSAPAAGSPSRGAPATPTATPTRPGTGRVFDRYFSSRPTPTPTPR